MIVSDHKNKSPLFTQLDHLANFAILAILPIAALCFFSSLEAWRGPAHIAGSFDPDYAYLFNSLNVLNGIPPGHHDHPGTTVQTWGGLTLRMKYPSETREVITEKVLKDPDAALSTLSFSLAALSTLILILAGIVAAQAFGSVWAGLAFQLFPMITPYYWDFIIRMTPDLLSMNLACLFLALFCRFYLKGELSVRQARVLGVIFGAAVASKVTAIPVILIPLYLCRKNLKAALTLLGASALSFLICIAPILRKGAWHFLVWNYELMTHSGDYGGGQAGLPTMTAWTASAMSLLTTVWVYPAVIGLGLLLVIIPFKGLKNPKLKNLLKLSLVLLLVQLFIVAKHPAGRYLMPAFAAASVVLAIGMNFFWRPWQAATACGVLVFFAFSLPISRARDQLKILDQTTTQEMLQVEMQKQDCRRLILLSNSSSNVHALFFGNNFARNSYAANLDRLYPGSVIFDLGQRLFLGFDFVAISPDKIAEIIRVHGPVCLLGPDGSLKGIEMAPFEFKLLFSGQGHDSLYSLRRR